MFSSSNLDRETPVDANVLLAELDKGLRSIKSGEQCEAIVRFPWVFERYPFPILINSACLKLADVFKNGSNFCKLLILRVIQESVNHLDKISNSEEFIRRIFSVSYSNDPVARAITLQVLASISQISHDRKDIHHCIRSSLDSTDEVEFSAAIEAAAAFANKSVEFAHNIYPKVLSKIKSVSTPVDTKILLMTVLRHPHYDSELAIRVRGECESFLLLHPSLKFAQVTLDTLTYISCASLTCVPLQINLTLLYFKQNKGQAIKNCVVKNLQTLARSSPHLWSKNNVEQLMQVTFSMREKCLELKSLDDELLFFGLLQILELLFRCPSLLQGDMETISKLNKSVEGICVRVIQEHFNFRTKSTCFQVLTSICIISDRCSESTDLTVLAFQTYFYTKMSESDEGISIDQINCRRSICQNVVRLSKFKEEVKDKMTACLRFILTSKDVSQSWIGMIAETLCAIESSNDTGTLYGKSVELIKNPKNELTDEVKTKLFTLAFQSAVVAEIDCDPSLADQVDGMNCWNVYRILRQSMRFGHFNFGNILTEKLKKNVFSELFYFWMCGLSKMCIAESYLTNDQLPFDSRLRKAISTYLECITVVKGVVSPQYQLQFQLEYLKLRLRTLQAHESFMLSCNLVRTSPAPAIAAAIASSTRDDLLKCGSVVTQMRKCSRELRSLSDSYSTLFQSSFNADHQTLAHLQLLQSSCTIIAEAIESIFQTNRVSSLFVDQHTHLENSRLDGDSAPSCEHQQLIKVCHKISSLVQKDLVRSSSTLDAGQIRLLNSISEDVLSVPLRVPRLFFQSVQMINVKLAVSPQPKVAGEPLVVSANNSLALKVEGVIVASQKTRLGTRTVSRVSLSVSSCPILKNGEFGQFGKAGELNLNCLVTPFKDYFQNQFLLTFPTSGLHSVTIEAAIIDDNDAQWKTGPTVQFNVKLLEEIMLR